MSKKKAIDLLLWEEGFYPFSLKYNLQTAFKKHKAELDLLEFDTTSEAVKNYSHHFNKHFLEICDALKNALSKSKLEKSEFMELIIADLNRIEVIIHEETKLAHQANKFLDYNQVSDIPISKPEFQNGSESSWALIDSAIDTANTNLNYLKYIKTGLIEEITEEIVQVDVIINLTFIGSAFLSVKHAYDQIIWRGYNIAYKDEILTLKPDLDDLMLNNVALIRLSRNNIIKFQELISSHSSHKTILDYYHQTRKFQKIKSISLNQETFTINYQKKDKNPSSSYCQLAAPILTHYPFYRSKKIAALYDLTLLDLVNLFSSLQDFVKLLPLPAYNDTEVRDLSKYRRFNPKVLKSELFRYFKVITRYTDDQIQTFLDLLTQRGDKHNLYRYPIYEQGDKYFFSQSIIKRANTLYLIDKWLEDGKCDLSDRGFHFEDYIKNFLKNETLNEFARFKMIEQSVFHFINEDGKRVEEEIDLVILTDTTLIVGEIKCSTYPLDPDDFYNSNQTLKKAANQINRKVKYLEDNWEKFETIIGKRGERAFEKIIIVNFPQFAGRKIKGIPVTDFNLFLSYFQSGMLRSMTIEKDKGTVRHVFPYYTSKESFENNFGQFFNDPTPIRELINRHEIINYEVSYEGSQPKIMSQRVQYNPKTDWN